MDLAHISEIYQKQALIELSSEMIPLMEAISEESFAVTGALYKL